MLFSPARLDVRSLAALRIGLGVTILTDLVVRSTDLAVHYGADGVMKCTPWSALRSPWHWDLFACTNPSGPAIHFAAATVAALMLTVGAFTRVATVVSFLLLASLHSRNWIVLNGGDALLRVITFWAIFLPLGDRFSFDAWWKRRKPGGAEALAARPTTVHSVATWAYLFQLLAVYSVAMFYRRKDTSWWDGTALQKIMDFDLYATHLGVWLREYHTLLVVANYATVAFELIGPALALIPVTRKGTFRTALVFAFVGLHIGIGATMNVGMFPVVCIVAWLGFLPTGFWDRVTKAETPLPSPVPRTWPRLAGNVGLALFIAYIVMWNGGRAGVPGLAGLMPPSVTALGHVLRLDQEWKLFHAAPRGDGWYLIVGKLADGTQLDLLHDGRVVTWEKPAYVLGEMPNRRWGKLVMNLKEKKNERHRHRLLHTMASDWNKREPCERQVVRAELVFMPEKNEGEKDKKVLWTYTKHWRKPECAAKVADTQGTRTQAQ